jgi:hypothetical protein
MEDRDLPAVVLGPAECCELARLISARCGVDMFVSFCPGIAVGESGGSGWKWEVVEKWGVAGEGEWCSIELLAAHGAAPHRCGRQHTLSSIKS